MEHKKLSDYAGWAQAGVASLIAAGGGMLWAGHTSSQVADQQQRIVAVENKQSADHDKVTQLAEQVNQIQKDTAETHDDVKTILQNQADVKAALEHFNRKVDHGPSR